jgi:cytochrome c peroxidase
MKWNFDNRHLAGAVTCAVLLQLTVTGCRSGGDKAGTGDHQETLTRIPDTEEDDEQGNKLTSLKGLKPAEPKDLGKYVRNRHAAIVLGKALFWDAQAGSDGQACASCHAHAGADHRKKNQLSSGLLNTAGPPKSETFNPTASNQPGGPNYTLVAADYPFHKLADINDRESAVLFDTDDTVSSQGVFKRAFVSTVEGPDGRETCTDQPDIFNIAGTNIRRVEPRNSPTTYNAAFFPRLFWDGRANNIFNGVTPFGPRDPNAKILERMMDGTTKEVTVRLENAALASQAVGPILSGFEMSCEGRTLPDVGHKLRTRRALALQDVAWDDSVLGAFRHPSGKGLVATYEQLIQDAFAPTYWGITTYSTVITDGTLIPIEKTDLDPLQLERNFGLFWGLSIMLYEATLISDDAPIDRYLDGDKTALTPEQVFGKALFDGPAKCVNCHHGPIGSGATFQLATQEREPNSIERMPMNDGRAALYDNGFYNIGVRPTDNDIGVGGVDPFGNPLSLARLAKIAAGGGAIPQGELKFNNQFFALNRGQDPRANERDAVDGAFKTPTLRNVELTGPYFHNGGQATLEQVIDFYNRGGDCRGGQLHEIDGEEIVTGTDTSGLGPNGTNLDPDIRRLHLAPHAKQAIVAFLHAFTDERVRWERAPFDHPSLSLPNGATPTNLDDRILVPAVGAGGRGALGLGPLQGFLLD